MEGIVLNFGDSGDAGGTPNPNDIKIPNGGTDNPNPNGDPNNPNNPDDNDGGTQGGGNPNNPDDTGGSSGGGVELIEVDGKQYTLDANGNAVGEDGQVAFTKDQLEPDAGDQPSQVQQVAEKTGIEIQDEEGKPVVFEDTIEGFAQRELAIANKVAKDTQASTLNYLYSTHPEIKQLLNYKELHGSLEGFSFKKNYSLYTYVADDVNNHKSLISEEFRLKGLSNEDIEMYVKSFEIEGKLSERALLAEKNLKQYAKDANAQEEAKVQEKRLAEQQSIEKEYGVTLDKKGQVVPLNIEGSYYDYIVSKGKIGAFEIPQTGITVKRDGKQVTFTREDIFNYIARNAGNGMSQAQIDDANYISNKENRLLRYLRHLTGVDGDKYIKTASPRPVRRMSIKGSDNNGGSNSGKIKLNFN